MGLQTLMTILQPQNTAWLAGRFLRLEQLREGTVASNKEP